MIAVCDFLCRQMSHEKVNSGFLWGLRLAFPNQKICFFAETTHLESIKYIVQYDGIDLGDIDYISIDISEKNSFKSLIKNFFIVYKIVKQLKLIGINKLFVLSFNPIIYKILTIFSNRYNIFFTCVLHGGLEEILSPISSNLTELPINSHSYYKTDNFLSLFIPRVKHLFNLLKNSCVRVELALLNYFFSYKKMFDNPKPSKFFNFIFLSPHIINTLYPFGVLNGLNVYTVVLPTVFKNRVKINKSDKIVRFAIFGYGKSNILRSVLKELDSIKIINGYEIRIIGMDNSGLEKFTNVTCSSPGKRLSREQMEAEVDDIDFFLILYDNTMYRVSCSGSILEALSYRKPIIHFENECIDFFNSEKFPIGYKVKTIKEFAIKMSSLIDGYNYSQLDIDIFKNNIEKLRTKYSIKNQLDIIKSSFTWNNYVEK